MSKSVCFDRSSRLTAATLLKSPRCRIFNPTHLRRLARVVRGCAPRNQEISQKCLSRITCLRVSATVSGEYLGHECPSYRNRSLGRSCHNSIRLRVQLRIWPWIFDAPTPAESNSQLFWFRAALANADETRLNEI